MDALQVKVMRWETCEDWPLCDGFEHPEDLHSHHVPHRWWRDYEYECLLWLRGQPYPGGIVPILVAVYSPNSDPSDPMCFIQAGEKLWEAMRIWQVWWVFQERS